MRRLSGRGRSGGRSGKRSGGRAGRGRPARDSSRRAPSPPPPPSGGVTGELYVTAAGDGLVLRDDGEAVARIPGARLGAAIHGDRVRVQIVREAPFGRFRGRRGPRRPTAEVREVLARGGRRLTGRVRCTGPGRVFEPDDPRLPRELEIEDGGGEVPDGAPVVAELRPLDRAAVERAAVRIVASFPDRDDVGVEIDRILLRDGLEPGFPPEAEAQAAAVTTAGLVGGERRDLLHLPFVTIDPEDARDHDDAVAVVPAAGRAGREGGVDVWVAIADVGAAVPSGSPLDAAARERGVSVYLPDRVIRMLPDALSAGTCSLREGELRAALAVRLRLEPDGRAAAPAEVMRAAVRSRAYLTYPQAGTLLAEESGGRRRRAGGPEVTEAVRASLGLAARVARTLRARRLAAGALDLEQPEAVIVPDGSGGIATIARRATSASEREAYRLVEELMLLANRGVARLLLGRGAPAIFRIHEPPAPEEVRRFAQVARHYGIGVRWERAAKPGALASALGAMRGRPFAEPLAGLLLRALAQARYAPDNLGHYGLAFREYLHFTSPIRRYPDLVVHRLVGALIDGATPGELAALGEREDVAEAAATASARERRAMLVEREVVDLCGAWKMRSHRGETFAGTVSGIGGPGVFVRLAEPFVEGCIALEDLPADEWRMVPEEARLWGASSGRSLRLGDPLRVVVLDASVRRRRVTLGPAPSRTGRRHADRSFFA